jgi:hypothetical protein
MDRGRPESTPERPGPPTVDTSSDSSARPPFQIIEKEPDLNTYRIHIRSDEFQYESEVKASNVEKEDGWTIFWNGNDVFMRIRDEHIVSLEHLI